MIPMTNYPNYGIKQRSLYELTKGNFTSWLEQPPSAALLALSSFFQLDMSPRRNSQFALSTLLLEHFLDLHFKLQFSRAVTNHANCSDTETQVHIGISLWNGKRFQMHQFYAPTTCTLKSWEGVKGWKATHNSFQVFIHWDMRYSKHTHSNTNLFQYNRTSV